MLKLMKRQTNQRRGITLLETVIALTVILLVSGAGVSIAVIFSKAEAKTFTRTEALSYSESVVECFRYCENNDELEAALALLDRGFIPVLSGEDNVFEDVADSAFIYKLEKDNYVITVISDYVQNKLEVQISYADGGEMNKLSYEKN